MALVYGVIVPVDRYFEIMAKKEIGRSDIKLLFEKWRKDNTEFKPNSNVLKFFLKHEALRQPAGLEIYLVNPKEEEEDDSSDDSSSNKSSSNKNFSDDSSSSAFKPFYSDCQNVILGIALEEGKIVTGQTIEEIYGSRLMKTVERRLTRFNFIEFGPKFHFHHEGLSGQRVKMEKKKLLP